LCHRKGGGFGGWIETTGGGRINKGGWDKKRTSFSKFPSSQLTAYKVSIDSRMSG
jgi:hypothetical protein